MNKPFKVGDRVAVYGSSIHRAYTGVRTTGLVDLVESDYINVETDSGRLLSFHPKQCRRLVKKERKTVYLVYPTYACSYAVAYFDLRLAETKCKEMGLGMTEVREFIEVRRKK